MECAISENEAKVQIDGECVRVCSQVHLDNHSASSSGCFAAD